MRNLTVATGLAILLGACGGDRRPAGEGGEGGVSDTVRPPGREAGTTHNVNMVLEGTTDYRYVPANLTIRPGDRIVFHNVSGPPHNVSFWPDSIPAGAQAVLEPQLPNPIGLLQSELLIDLGRTITISFTGAPVGEYKYYCTPHLAMGMRGTITVTP